MSPRICHVVPSVTGLGVVKPPQLSRASRKSQLCHPPPPPTGVSLPDRVLAGIEEGKLRGGGWREQYIASAIGLLASGCITEAATHAAHGSVDGGSSNTSGERGRPDGLDFVARNE